jgi:hypothetical protein
LIESLFEGLLVELPLVKHLRLQLLDFEAEFLVLSLAKDLVLRPQTVLQDLSISQSDLVSLGFLLLELESKGEEL